LFCVGFCFFWLVGGGFGVGWGWFGLFGWGGLDWFGWVGLVLDVFSATGKSRGRARAARAGRATREHPRVLGDRAADHHRVEPGQQRGAGRAASLRFTASARTVGHLRASDRDFQPNRWAKVQVLSPAL
jgi:hypothetical protein